MDRSDLDVDKALSSLNRSAEYEEGEARGSSV